MVFFMSTMKSACNITVNEICLYHLFIYLGSLFTSDGICEQDVRLRIGIAKSTFISMEKFLKARNIDLQLCYVWATLLYGCETWTLSGDMMKQLDAVEPSNGVPIYRFWTSWLCRPAGWLALLLKKDGDVETIPVPTTTHKQVWIYDIGHKQI